MRYGGFVLFERVERVDVLKKTIEEAQKAENGCAAETGFARTL
jgi:hypothetical protein